MRRFLGSLFTLFFSAHLHRSEHLVALLLFNYELFFARLPKLVFFVDSGRLTHLAINLSDGLGKNHVFRHRRVHLEILVQLSDQGEQV